MEPEEVLEAILTADGQLRIVSEEGDEAVVRVLEKSDPFDVQAVNVGLVRGDDPGNEGRAQIRSEQNEDSSWSRPVAYWVGHEDDDLEWRIVEAEEV